MARMAKVCVRVPVMIVAYCDRENKNEKRGTLGRRPIIIVMTAKTMLSVKYNWK